MKLMITVGIKAKARPTMKLKSIELPASYLYKNTSKIGKGELVTWNLKLGFPVAVFRIDSYMN